MYNTEVRVFVVGGATPNPSSVTATLFLLETTIDSENVAHDHDVPKETVSPSTSPFDLFVKAPLAFTGGPSFFLPNDETRQIALTVSDPRFSGFIFRSGKLDTLPTGFPQDPNGFIEVVLPEPIVFPLGGPVSGLSLPMAVPGVPGARVTGATITPGNGSFTLVLTGTVPGGVTFTYTVAVGLSPSMSVRDTGEVFVAAPTSKPTMRFTGGTPLAKVEAALLNFLGPLIADQALPSVVSSVTSGVNASAMAAVASVMLPGPNPMARSGVTVCAQAVILRADDTNSFAVAVGNFGKIFPDPHQDGGGGSSCALSAALAVLPTLRLDLFRAFRDNVLARSRIGRDCIALYYAHSAEIRDLVLLSPRLMAKTAELVREMERDLASGGSLSAKAVQKLGSFLNGLAANGSASLRRDLSELSSRMAWVVQGPGVLGGLGSV